MTNNDNNKRNLDKASKTIVQLISTRIAERICKINIFTYESFK